MENENKISENTLSELDKIDSLLKHIKGVQDNCIFLGKKLIRDGKSKLGRTLIANSLKHDNSKFLGIEWDLLATNENMDELSDGKKILKKQAIKQHNLTNQHHPQYWGNIHKMPPVFVAEMVCDWKTRSSEFGSDLKKWIFESSTERYNYSMDDKVGEQIKYYLSLLLDAEFK